MTALVPVLTSFDSAAFARAAAVASPIYDASREILWTRTGQLMVPITDGGEQGPVWAALTPQDLQGPPVRPRPRAHRFTTARRLQLAREFRVRPAQAEAAYLTALARTYATVVLAPEPLAKLASQARRVQVEVQRAVRTRKPDLIFVSSAVERVGALSERFFSRFEALAAENRLAVLTEASSDYETLLMLLEDLGDEAGEVELSLSYAERAAEERARREKRQAQQARRRAEREARAHEAYPSY